MKRTAQSRAGPGRNAGACPVWCACCGTAPGSSCGQHRLVPRLRDGSGSPAFTPSSSFKCQQTFQLLARLQCSVCSMHERMSTLLQRFSGTASGFFLREHHCLCLACVRQRQACFHACTEPLGVGLETADMARTALHCNTCQNQGQRNCH